MSHHGQAHDLHITGDEQADQVLTADPFALLVGMLLDQQYPMEHAFRGPPQILDTFGTPDPVAPPRPPPPPPPQSPPPGPPPPPRPPPGGPTPRSSRPWPPHRRRSTATAAR